MKLYFVIFTIFLAKASFINSDCPCGEITPNIVEGAGLSAYLSSPADSNGNKCIPSQACTYQLAYIVLILRILEQHYHFMMEIQHLDLHT